MTGILLLASVIACLIIYLKEGDEREATLLAEQQSGLSFDAAIKESI